MKQIILAGIFMFSAPLWGQEQTANKAKINLEEEEVTLMDNGKVTATRYVSIKGAEKAAILKEVKERNYKKLGIQNEADISGRNLRGKLDEERKKTIKVKRLQHPRLKFIDVNGIPKKELVLGHDVVITTHTDAAGKSTQFKTVVSRDAEVSRDQQHAVYTERHADSSTFPGSTGNVKYFNVNGDVVWEKQYPKFKIGGGMASDDGSLIFLTESWTENWISLPPNEPYYQFVAYNAAGKMLFSFPKTREEEKNYRINGNIVASPNGRYVSVKAEKQKNNILIFFDVSNKSWWAYDEKEAFVLDISDEGVCRIGLYTGAKVEIIDLKKGIFEPLK